MTPIIPDSSILPITFLCVTVIGVVLIYLFINLAKDKYKKKLSNDSQINSENQVYNTYNENNMYDENAIKTENKLVGGALSLRQLIYFFVAGWIDVLLFEGLFNGEEMNIINIGIRVIICAIVTRLAFYLALQKK